MVMTPPGQMTTMSLPGVDQAVEQSEFNALRNDAAKFQNEEVKGRAKVRDQMEDAKFLNEIGTGYLERLTADPQAYAKSFSDLKAELIARGMDELANNMPDPKTTSIEQLMQQFAKMRDIGADGMAGRGPATTYGAPVKGVGADGTPEYFSTPSTGELNPTGVEAPAGGSGGNARGDYFNMLSDYAKEVDENGQSTDRAVQAQTQLGTTARVGSSSLERIAGDDDLQNNVIDYRTELAGGEAFAKAEGASRSGMIDDAAAGIHAIESNIRNLDRAYAELEAGALTGPIISKYAPTIRAATVALEQTRASLGLDVVGSVTFGALSEGEMRLAMAVALPNLPPEELKIWIKARQVAQGKLLDYYMEQIEHLDNGGTVASFMRTRTRKAKGQPLALQQALAAIAEKPENRLLIIEKYVEQGYDAGDLF